MLSSAAFSTGKGKLLHGPQGLAGKGPYHAFAPE